MCETQAKAPCFLDWYKVALVSNQIHCYKDLTYKMYKRSMAIGCYSISPIEQTLL